MDAVTTAAAEAGEYVSTFDPNDKYIGLALAVSSSVAIGTSFIITKKGLISAADAHDGFASSSYSYLRNSLWWAGMLTMVVGEVANFAAYTFAPPALVTPLGALSVLVGAVLAAIFLGERLGKIGVVGCSLCLVGSLVIVLHAPEDKEINTVDEILEYALQPGFMFYCFCVLVFSLYMIHIVAPRHGNSNPLVYISICSLVGSVSVMAVKGFGVALKLTFAGNNQLWRAGTWIFAFTVAGCIAVQMNYFNKALDLFPTTNPMYFSFFSTATLIASVILFHGLGTTGGVNTFTLFCGFYTISMGVYLINLSRSVSDADASRRYSSAAARHSLLQDTRISLTSDSGHGHHAQPDARRSATLYRAGGLTTGGVEPLFDYEDSPVEAQHAHGKFEDRDQGRRRGETAVQMEHFALANDHDGSESEGEGEGEGGRGGGGGGGGYRR
ncbi:hypothetical protein JCM8208_003853 [Rhodotorula glutinis]